MLQPVQKITLKLKEVGDFLAINNAVITYLHYLQDLKQELNYIDQHIHYSLLYAFSFEIKKRLVSRVSVNNPRITLEVHTALVLFDALTYYDNICEDHQESAVLYRIKVAVHEELPRTVDGKTLSIKRNY